MFHETSRILGAAAGNCIHGICGVGSLVGARLSLPRPFPNSPQSDQPTLVP